MKVSRTELPTCAIADQPPRQSATYLSCSKASIAFLRREIPYNQPVQPQSREPFLDAVRGLALVGILAVNLEHFAGVELYATLHGEDSDYVLGQQILAFFFSGKFYTIFSILFGLGLALQYQRLVAAGLAANVLLKRRLGWLLGLGALHGIFCSRAISWAPMPWWASSRCAT